MKRFKWQQRAIAAEKAVEKAERAERYQRFWEAVSTPKLVESQPETLPPHVTERRPVDWDDLPA